MTTPLAPDAPIVSGSGAESVLTVAAGPLATAPGVVEGPALDTTSTVGISAASAIGPQSVANNSASVSSTSSVPSAAPVSNGLVGLGLAQAMASIPMPPTMGLVPPGLNSVSGTNSSGAQGNRPRHSGQSIAEQEPAVKIGGSAVPSEDPTNSTESRITGVVASLVESLPVDLNELDTTLDHCLGRIDAMSESLTEMLMIDGAWPWLAGAFVGSAAGAVAGFLSRKDRLDPFSPAIEGMPSPLFPEPLARV